MGATQGVILIMVSSLALFLIWSGPFNKSKFSSPLVKGEDAADPTKRIEPPTTGTPNPKFYGGGSGDANTDLFPIPPGCTGTFADYWCGSVHYIFGTRVSSQVTPTVNRDIIAFGKRN